VPDDLFDLRADRLTGDVERRKGRGRDSLSFVDQSQKDVLGSEIVAKQARFLLRQHHHAMGPVRELLEHVPSVRHSAAETLLADYCFVV
jgi:hypothetical protein